MIPRQDYYQILGLQPGSSITDVKRSYGRLAQQCQFNLTRDDDTQRRAEEAFYLINEAYDMLCDPDRKAQYDEFLADQMIGNPIVHGPDALGEPPHVGLDVINAIDAGPSTTANRNASRVSMPIVILVIVLAAGIAALIYFRLTAHP